MGRRAWERMLASYEARKRQAQKGKLRATMRSSTDTLERRTRTIADEADHKVELDAKKIALKPRFHSRRGLPGVARVWLNFSSDFVPIFVRPLRRISPAALMPPCSPEPTRTLMTDRIVNGTARPSSRYPGPRSGYQWNLPPR